MKNNVINAYVSANGYGNDTECLTIYVKTSGGGAHSSFKISDKKIAHYFSDQFKERLDEWEKGISWLDIGNSAHKRIR